MKVYFIKLDKKKSIDKSSTFSSIFTKHWYYTSIFLKFVALPFPIFRILLLVYIYIYICVSIHSQLFIRATHTSDFHASSFPRNWREIVEHQAFPRNQNVPQFEVDASTCVTQPGLERSVLFSFPFSFLFFYSPFLFVLQREESWLGACINLYCVSSVRNWNLGREE